ncbi:hypothetical protein BCR44DRAFT_60674 [Catenaria anguillulae PL171]|uniref:Uncharacterized protein n=1 Tax=Catenaria anguillulae PL171 TaxID=765915 RepID=A0A1Y2HVY4_9FUNG|nr:hypothetical protein BCR44DRAFT_60674 [Catenaria anguillulae PL171]
MFPLALLHSVMSLSAAPPVASFLLPIVALPSWFFLAHPNRLVRVGWSASHACLLACVLRGGPHLCSSG